MRRLTALLTMVGILLVSAAVPAAAETSDPGNGGEATSTTAEATDATPVAITVKSEMHGLISSTEPSIAVAPECSWSIEATFSGSRVLGVVSGTWQTFVRTVCTGSNMDYLRVDGHVVDNFANVYTIAGSYCYNCDGVVTGRTDRCTICNGGWSFTSDHRLDLPSGYVWTTPLPNGCRRAVGDTADKMTCTLSTSATIA